MAPAALYEPEILVVGAGIIGLSIAIELRRRGAHVLVVESSTALSSSSIAAAGMLAARDPHNPARISALALHSLSLYGRYLSRMSSESGLNVPFQTTLTVQHLAGGATMRLSEHSLDPRQLAASLLAAIHAASIPLVEHTRITAVTTTSAGITATAADGRTFRAQRILYTTGAWTPPTSTATIPVAPRKGQMLRVEIPASSSLHEVHRSEHIYIVPRTLGPQAGSALIGATVEDAGFDLTTHPADLTRLREAAAALDPALSFCCTAPQLEAWAGLRPATPDALPILGRIAATPQFVATGHFRNGILLAPATAQIMADLLEDKQPAIDITDFSPARFAQ